MKCCSACFNRIARKLGSVAMTTEPENPIPEEGPGELQEQAEGEYRGEKGLPMCIRSSVKLSLITRKRVIGGLRPGTTNLPA